MNHYKENTFTKILRGELKIDKVYEDDLVLSFRDHMPDSKFESHFLIIPKKNFIDFNDFVEKESNEGIANYFKAIKTITEKFGYKNFKLEANVGSLAHVPHLHFHIKCNYLG